MKKSILKSDGFQSLTASLICIVLGLLVGYIVLLFINPQGASQAILAVIKNFMTYSRASLQMKNLGNTLVNTVPLLMCSLSILFAYKVGLFNIGAAGQYCVGAAACLYAALAWQWGWVGCMVFAIVVSAVMGALVGLLKAYCNVNEVISGIMLNWIALYATNMVLGSVKDATQPYTLYIKDVNPTALLPTLGLGKLFAGNDYVGISIPVAILMAVAVQVMLNCTRFGYELRATGNNKNAAKYCGMAEKRNIILTLVIAGALAGLGAALMYQTGYTRWETSQSTVPAMGFNGIAAAFLGGLNPIGAIFSSFFIQHITFGGAYVDKSIYCSQISDLISAIIIYLCGFVLFIKYVMNTAAVNREEKAAAKLKEASGEKGGEA